MRRFLLVVHSRNAGTPLEVQHGRDRMKGMMADVPDLGKGFFGAVAQICRSNGRHVLHDGKSSAGRKILIPGG